MDGDISTKFDSKHQRWDELDHRLLQALEVDGRAPFSRLASHLGVSDQTIARRYRRLAAEIGLRVVAVRDAERLGQTWVLRLRCAPDAANALSRALARRIDTAWIALTSGGTEVVCAIRFRTRGEHEEMILGKLPRTPSIMEIRAHQILWRFFGGANSWLAKHLPEAATDFPASRDSAPLPPEPISPEDEPLVRALEKDGRATLAELRRATGHSEAALRHRLDRLLTTGSLYIDVQYDQAVLGGTVRAILWITAAPAALDQVGRALAVHPEVTFAGAMAGSCNLMAFINCRDSTAMYRYLSVTLGSLEGVQHVETAPVLRLVKQLTYDEHAPSEQ
ncbi:Lrp/AsnC family transcriptional regulator [Nonomuraea sp. NPDC050153]|uniref:Lrp/AsnC family transcriptional regulator n=1 Tax=Nonomuraea sp. NPDC050153 TaxID=3364359 RepID=UPI00378CBA23